jgi:hypothetical protein
MARKDCKNCGFCILGVNRVFGMSHKHPYRYNYLRLAVVSCLTMEMLTYFFYTKCALVCRFKIGHATNFQDATSL